MSRTWQIVHDPINARVRHAPWAPAVHAGAWREDTVKPVISLRTPSSHGRRPWQAGWPTPASLLSQPLQPSRAWLESQGHLVVKLSVGVVNITSIFKTVEKRKREKGSTPSPSAFTRQLFWNLLLPSPTHISSRTSLAGALQATPHPTEAAQLRSSDVEDISRYFAAYGLRLANFCKE